MMLINSTDDVWCTGTQVTVTWQLLFIIYYSPVSFIHGPMCLLFKTFCFVNILFCFDEIALSHLSYIEGSRLWRICSSWFRCISLLGRFSGHLLRRDGWFGSWFIINCTICTGGRGAGFRFLRCTSKSSLEGWGGNNMAGGAASSNHCFNCWRRKIFSTTIAHWVQCSEVTNWLAIIN